MKAMILAAGRGERLRPLTDVTPKALIEVGGQPLIVHHLQNLAKSGINDIVINLAHLGDKIKNRLGTGEQYGVNITYSEEPEGGLETGGGIVKALPYLGTEPFVTVNADIYSNYDFSQLLKLKGQPAHLILVQNPPHNRKGDYDLDGNHLIISPEQNPFTFSGIAVYHPDFFSRCQLRRFSVTTMIKRTCSQNLITAETFEDMWHDIGTERRLKAAEKEIKLKNINTEK